jgi:hypothetical protein
MVMRTQHEDTVLAAHRRRARLIAQLQEQATAAANNDLSAQHVIKAGTTRRAHWQKADWIIARVVLRVIGAAILIAGIGCILLGL